MLVRCVGYQQENGGGGGVICSAAAGLPFVLLPPHAEILIVGLTVYKPVILKGYITLCMCFQTKYVKRHSRPLGSSIFLQSLEHINIENSQGFHLDTPVWTDTDERRGRLMDA